MKSIKFLPALFVLFCVLQPASIEAQYCGTTGAPAVYSDTTMKTVTKMLNSPYFCFLTAAVGGAMCTPANTAPGVVFTIVASVTKPASPAAVCGWNCIIPACTVAIDSSDGLPVELMEFSIESE